jgi:autotransporter adhesin
MSATLGQADRYTDKEIASTRQYFKTHADAGVAASMAVSGIPQAFTPGKIILGAGFGTWRGQPGFAAGGSAILDDGRTAVRAGATFDGRGGAGFSAGIGFQF